ncbi:50S ribosomal protein L25, partial [Citrobacter sp. AAK_AS5]
LHQNAVFLVHVKGADEKPHVMVRDVMLSPLRRELLHVDFVRILLDRKLRVKVPVETVGTALGVKLGGLLDVVTRELEVECLPADI